MAQPTLSAEGRCRCGQIRFRPGARLTIRHGVDHRPPAERLPERLAAFVANA